MQKKILIIASWAESLLNFRLHLIKAFMANGYTVTALAPADEKVAQALKAINVKFVPIFLPRTGNNPLKDLASLKSLYQAIKHEQPDIVFSYTIKPVIYGTLAAKLAGVPRIYSMLTGTGYAFTTHSMKAKLVGLIAKNLFRFSLRFNTLLFFQNKDNLATFRDDRLITENQRVAIINGSGVDVTHFSPTPLPRTLSFLLVGRLLVDKGIREYVAAAQQIKANYPQATFHLVGWFDTNPSSITQAELAQWVKSGVIIYHGHLSDVRPAIIESAIYVLPSYGEGTPRTVLEAMAMGRPIITTDVPGCRETVKAGVNGLLIPARDTSALCQAIEYFILHPEKIAEMGEQSRRIALEKYDVHKVNQHMLTEMEILGTV